MPDSTFVPVFTNLEKQKAVGDEIRTRLLALCISQEDAKAAGYKSISQPYGMRLYAQVFELDRAVKDLGASDYRLVLSFSNGKTGDRPEKAFKNERISIWRKR